MIDFIFLHTLKLSLQTQWIHLIRKRWRICSHFSVEKLQSNTEKCFSYQLHQLDIKLQCRHLKTFMNPLHLGDSHRDAPVAATPQCSVLSSHPSGRLPARFQEDFLPSFSWSHHWYPSVFPSSASFLYHSPRRNSSPALLPVPCRRKSSRGMPVHIDQK